MKRDVERTAAAGFMDSRSFVRPDGRWECRGDDMGRVRKLVYEWDGGKCRCCGREWSWLEGEIDHIIPKSKGRDDRPSNLRWICPWWAPASCHTAKHLHLEKKP